MALWSFLAVLVVSMAAAQRREHVQVLRHVAAGVGVERCKDNAGREMVKAMYEEALKADGLVDDEREKAEAAWAAYRQTFPGGWLTEAPGEEPDDNDEGDSKRWRFKAAQLTYNCTPEALAPQASTPQVGIFIHFDVAGVALRAIHEGPSSGFSSSLISQG